MASSARAAPVPPGYRLGRFRLEEYRGRGAFGEVYRAVDGRTGRTVALKLLAQDDRAEAREGLTRETRALERIQHPLVAGLIDAGDEGGRLYLAIAWTEGRSLRQVLEEGRLGPDAAMSLARDLAEALAHVHALGLTHGDLKPENILLDDAGRAHLVDFGLARAADLPPPPPGAGTPRYLAPEQAAGRPASPATDLWQLGLTLFEALAGRPAFRGRSDPRELPALPEGTPEPLARLVRALADSSPSGRPAAAAIAARLPAPEVSGLPALTAPTAPLPVGPDQGRSHPAGPGAARPAIVPVRSLAGHWLLGVVLGVTLRVVLRLPIATVATGLFVVAAGLAWDESRRDPEAPPRDGLRLSALAWGVLPTLLVTFQGRFHGDPFLMIGTLPAAMLAVMTGVPLLVFAGRHVSAAGLARATSPEVGPPTLLEALVPGTGQALQGRVTLGRRLGIGLLLFASAALVSRVAVESLVLLFPLAALAWLASLGSVLAQGAAQLEEREKEEARLLIELGEQSPERVRCQAGMGLVTASLVAALRRGDWKVPTLERGRARLAGPVVEKTIAALRDPGPCFAAARVSLMGASGRIHLFCERHDLCPSPLPKPVDREAPTAAGELESAGGVTRLRDD